MTYMFDNFALQTTDVSTDTKLYPFILFLTLHFTFLEGQALGIAV